MHSKRQRTQCSTGRAIAKRILSALASSLGLALGLAWFAGCEAAEPAVAPEPVGTERVKSWAEEPIGQMPAAESRERTPIVRDLREAATTVHGWITDRANAPIADATVKLYEWPPGAGVSIHRAQMTTDADGWFSMSTEGLFIGWAGVRVSAPGFLDEVRELASEEPCLEIRLTRPTAVFGRVLDAETGMPIPDASIQRYGWAATVRSDASGRYRLDGFHMDYPGQLVVSKFGYLPALVPVPLKGEAAYELDVELAPDMQREVVVFDRDSGRPIVGAEVRRSRSGELLASTDENGRFEMRVGVGSDLRLKLTAPGFVPLVWRWRVESLDGLAHGLPHRIPIWRWASIEGRVCDAEGRPLPGCIAWSTRDGSLASLTLTAEERRALDLPGSIRYEARTREAIATNADGRYVLPVVPSSEPQSVTFHHRDHPTARSESVVLASGGQRASVDAVLNAGGIVRGRALKGGQPWCQEVAWQLGKRDGKAPVRPDGSFELRNVPAGEVRVFASMDGDVSPCEVRVVVEAGSVSFVELAWE